MPQQNTRTQRLKTVCKKTNLHERGKDGVRGGNASGQCGISRGEAGLKRFGLCARSVDLKHAGGRAYGIVEARLCTRCT
eukprot:2286291-Rhodomonas_salina.2